MYLILVFLYFFLLFVINFKIDIGGLLDIFLIDVDIYNLLDFDFDIILVYEFDDNDSVIFGKDNGIYGRYILEKRYLGE